MQPPNNVQPPMSDWNGGQNKQDEDQLNMLMIFYYIVAALNLMGICLGAFYAFFFPAMIASAPRSQTDGALPAAGIFVGFGLFLMVLSVAIAALNYFAGKAIKERRSQTLVFVAAGLNCLNFPFGTALGIFTFIVLSRPSVKALFTS